MKHYSVGCAKASDPWPPVSRAKKSADNVRRHFVISAIVSEWCAVRPLQHRERFENILPIAATLVGGTSGSP